MSPTPRDFCDLLGCVGFIIIQGKQLNAYCHIVRAVFYWGVAKESGAPGVDRGTLGNPPKTAPQKPIFRHKAFKDH